MEKGKRAGIAAFGHRQDEISWPAFAPRVGSGQTLRLRQISATTQSVSSCDKEKLSTRGRCSCCSRPKVALLAAEGNATRGRESMTCKALRERSALGRGKN